jgi:MarR family transcriptional regulator for hemolysin
MSRTNTNTNTNAKPDFGRVLLSLSGQINRQWRRALDRRLQPLGLTEATWLPLLYIARATQPLRQKDLAALMGLDSSSVVRLLDGLQTAGYIQRLEGTDRREKIIHLTDTGKQTVSSVEQVVLEGRRRLFLDIDDADLETTRTVLQQLLGTLESLDGALWSDTDGADSHA